MKLEALAQGFGYVESPRWHDGRLWLSDFDCRQVVTVTAGGDTGVFSTVPGKPSGLAFRGAEVLVASMNTAEVLAIDDAGTVRPYADLAQFAVGPVNDMLLTDRQVLYVGCFGYDLAAREKPRPGPLLAISATGQVSVACPDVSFANGMALSNDGDWLFVAESAGHRISRFKVSDTGSLSERTVFADLERSHQPDGMCIDAEDGIWFGSPFAEQFVRLDRSGTITHVVRTPGRWAVACTLGGHDGTTFFGLTAETDMVRFHEGSSLGRVEIGTAPYPARS